MLAKLTPPHLLPFPIRSCPTEGSRLFHLPVLLCQSWIKGEPKPKLRIKKPYNSITSEMALTGGLLVHECSLAQHNIFERTMRVPIMKGELSMFP